MTRREGEGTTFGSDVNNISLYNDSKHSVERPRRDEDELTPNVPMMLKAVPYSLVHAKSVFPVSFGRIISGKLPDQNNECID